MDFWHFFEKNDPFNQKEIWIFDTFLKDTWFKKQIESTNELKGKDRYKNDEGNSR